MGRLNSSFIGLPFYLKRPVRGFINAYTGEVCLKVEDRLAYVAARDGFYRVKRGSSFFSVKRIWLDAEENFGWLGPAKERLSLVVPKKIPFRLLDRAAVFFGKVYGQLESEAALLIYWDIKSRQYKLFCPKQKVEECRVKYDLPPTPENRIRVGTIHSHCDFDAFHSPTDRDDEKNEDGLHITIGSVDAKPAYVLSLVVDGKRKRLRLFDVFAEEVPGEFIRRPRTPKKWLERVSRKVKTKSNIIFVGEAPFLKENEIEQLPSLSKSAPRGFIW